MSQEQKFVLGIDLGGTFIKGGVADIKGNILASEKVCTNSEKGAENVAKNIADLCKLLLKKADLEIEQIIGIGIGVPGMIDSKNGVVIFSGNLKWENFNLAKCVGKYIDLPIKIANDANVATLGETIFGSGKNYSNTVMLTLGTGVGGGVVIEGKLLEGNGSAGAELGHMVIHSGGEDFTCGRKGCLEAYSSATALIRDTKKAMQEDKNSKMWQIGSLDNVDGKTAFAYKDEDNTAKQVVDKYIKNLAVGITNFANIFRPETIILGGGISGEGDNLIKPLSVLVEKEIFAGAKGPKVNIVRASLGNNAGVLGAVALWL